MREPNPTAADIDLRYALKLAPAEAVDYFKRKGFAITDDWRELWQEAHNRAFTVAKMAEHDLLVKTREIIDRKLAEGLTARQAAAELEAEFKRAGWWGKRAADGARLGSARRIRTILRTNAATAYAAGRHQRQKANVEGRPWWRYVAVMDGVTRLAHRQLHGKILKHDDPAWQAIYPPNGFNCRCRVQALSKRQAKAAFAADPAAKMAGEAPQTRDVDMVNKRTGEVFQRSVTDVKLTDADGQVRWFAPDAGWGHQPGAGPLRPAGRTLDADPDQPDFRTYKIPVEMEAFDADPKRLSISAIDTAAKSLGALRAAFDIKAGGSRRIATPDGLDDVVIYDAMLPNLFMGEDKFRARYANYIVPTLERPNEVWITGYRIEGARQHEYRLHYIKAWSDKSLFVIVTEDAAGNLFYNFIPISKKNKINKMRRGALLYRWTTGGK